MGWAWGSIWTLEVSSPVWSSDTVVSPHQHLPRHPKSYVIATQSVPVSAKTFPHQRKDLYYPQTSGLMASARPPVLLGPTLAFLRQSPSRALAPPLPGIYPGYPRLCSSQSKWSWTPSWCMPLAKWPSWRQTAPSIHALRLEGGQRAGVCRRVDEAWACEYRWREEGMSSRLGLGTCTPPPPSICVEILKFLLNLKVAIKIHLSCRSREHMLFDSG